MYEKMHESGFIKILHELHISNCIRGLLVQSIEHPVIILISSQSALSISDCSGLRLNPYRTEW